ncbi:MAG: hypothetical protein KAW40_00925 [Candidatus Aenigmarchaeota archaeon]|nr:hypothetical protein [Candidatus Aenigmarchaeota archaeon]
MKLTSALVLVVLVATIVISGCVQEPTGGLTEEQAEDQALQTLEQEMDEAIGGMTLEELENELLQQG